LLGNEIKQINVFQITGVHNVVSTFCVVWVESQVYSIVVSNSLIL